MIKVLQNVFNKILEDCRNTYPNECCGVLVGTIKGEKKVIEAYKAENTNKQRAKDRYEIDPKEFLGIERKAKDSCLEVIGFYHSHPEHPARPSEFDRQRAWPEYSYIIASVTNGRDVEVKSWTFLEMDGPFREEKLIVE